MQRIVIGWLAMLMTAQAWSQGVDHQEVRETIREKLEGYGVELPERPERGRGFAKCHRGPGRFHADLTETQRKELHRTLGQMLMDGAEPKEVHEAMQDKMESFGIELPEDPWEEGGRPPFPCAPHRILTELSESQREDVLRRIGEMMVEDASRKEIHRSVAF